MMDKLDVIGLAAAFGVIWGLCVMLAGWMAIFGWGTAFVNALNFYPGYGATLLGGVVGGMEGFVDGAVAGAIVALVYNCVTSRERRRSSGGTGETHRRTR